MVRCILQLAYLDAIINETLRLYPPIWSLAGRAVQDDRFGNNRIRKGTTIFIVPLITQRDRRYFSDPEHFLPERFTEGEIKSRTFLPFGRGQHTCIEGDFAWQELKMILAMLFQHQNGKQLLGRISQ